MAEIDRARDAAPARGAVRGAPRPAGAAHRTLQRAHAVGRLHRGRRDPPLLAPRPYRTYPRRLRDRARDGAPCRAEPFAPLLAPGGRALSRLARRARAARAGRRGTAHSLERTDRRTDENPAHYAARRR